MVRSEAQRTLIKSPLELWEELSDPASLARHLGEFGEIRITRMDQQRTLEWEADSLTGTIELLTAGWGTRVTLTVAGERQDAVEGACESDPAAGAPPHGAGDAPLENDPAAGAPSQDAGDAPLENDPAAALSPHDAGDAQTENDPAAALSPHDAGDAQAENDPAAALSPHDADDAQAESDPAAALSPHDADDAQADSDPAAAAPPEDPAEAPAESDPAGALDTPGPRPPRRGFFARLFRRRDRERATDEPRAAAPGDSEALASPAASDPVSAAEPPEAPADASGELASPPASESPAVPSPIAPEPAAGSEPPAERQPETWLEEIEDEREAAQRSTADAWRQQPQTETITDERAEAILLGMLDRLGSAHHRPYSRAG